MRRLAAAIVLIGAAACVHARPIDVGALVAKDGLDGAAEELRFRVASDTHDRAALAALGEVEAERGRPGAAVDALARAALLGGAPGDPLPARDRARLAALYVARAAERAARGAPAAEDDLERARKLGAAVGAALAHDASVAVALADLRHADPRRRAHGQAELATPVSGAWLWDHGARRAALDALDAWVARGGLDATPPNAGALDAAARWLDAHAWWNGQAPPAAVARARALGVSTCAIAAQPVADCTPAGAVGAAQEAGFWRRAEVRGWIGDEPTWLVLAARAWLRGDTRSYTAAVRVHFQGPAIEKALIWMRPTMARLAGRPPAEVAAALDAATAEVGNAPNAAKLVVAVELALAGRSADDVAAALGPDPDAAGAELLARLRAPAPAAAPDLAHAAAARALRGETTAGTPSSVDGLAAVAAAYLHDPASADRAADDWIARDVDVAARAPIAAALFAALGDPARARALWQRAADASPGEARVLRGLAIAVADADDPDAAEQLATEAAAASGDTGPTLVAVARAIGAHGRYDHALEIAHLALQLVAPDARAPIYDLAIAWSRAEGKDVTELVAARAQLGTPPEAPRESPEAREAIDDELAARLDPRDPAPRLRLLALPAGDPRRARARAELAAIAADPLASDDDAAAAWAAFAGAKPR